MPLTGSSAGCNAPTLLDYLADRGLTSYGQTDPDESLVDRNRDRLRVLRYLAQHPEGASQTAICHDVLKGVDPTTYTGHFSFDADPDWRDRVWTQNEWVFLDGSDADYQFLNRFIKDLTQETDLIRTESLSSGDSDQQRFVYPTPELLDLISEGITETTTQTNDLVYDREFCLNLLKSKRSELKELTDSEKNLLANSLRRYIQRVRDYRLCFDVHLANRTGYDVKRMEKPYATRFTDQGRIDKQFAMLQAALEAGYDVAEAAVFATYTTDPKKFDSLLDAIEAINPNFHDLQQWLKSDPSTADDTRRSDVPAWRPELDSSNYEYFPDGVPTGGPPEGPVTGRPRKNLDYIKVLEFDGSGKPHLHVLYFDPPRRESDGMPWLCDKDELSHRWNKDNSRPGQARVVDTWPLVYRDDLDDIEEAEFNAEEGFVSWYRYGDHDHSQHWIENQSRTHNQIDMDGDDENPMQKTAGSYIGKYVSKNFGLLQNLEELDDPEWADEKGGKTAWWKLALYWCTQRRFWSPSENIRQQIKLDGDRSEIRRGVADATRTSLHRLTDDLHDDHALYPDLEPGILDAYLGVLTRDLVAESDVAAQEAHHIQTTLARVEYLGAFHRDDMPRSPYQRLDSEPFETATNTEQSGVTIASTGDRPPPASDVWS